MVNKDGAAVLPRRVLVKALMLLLLLFKSKLHWTTVGMLEKKRQLRVVL